MKQQNGFTLVELMIVLAIVGILSALALPAYRDYTGKAQAAESFRVTAGVRAQIALRLAESGSFPGAGSQVASDALLLEGKYFPVGGVTVADGGVVDVTFDDGVHVGESITLTPNESAAGGQVAEWSCSGLDAKFLPHSC